MVPSRNEIVKMDDKYDETSDIKQASPQTTYFVETTTMHGVKQVSGAPGILKYIWLLVFLALTCLLVWHSHRQIVKYLKYETKTSILTKWNLSAEFPAVTVCNLNSAKRSLLEDDVFWQGLLEMDEVNRTDLENIVEYLWGNFSQSNSSTIDTDPGENQANGTFNDGQNCSDEGENGDAKGIKCGEGFSDSPKVSPELNQTGFKDSRKFFYDLLEQSETKDPSDIMNWLLLPPEVIQKAGYTQEEFIVECTFHRATCPSDAFTKSYDSSYGNCFTFNLGMTKNPITTNESGLVFGLKLSLNIQAKQYIGFLSSEYGARVTVQESRALASPLADGFNAAPGQLTAVGISRKRIIRLKYPYDTLCTDEFPAEYASFVVPNAIYTHEGCIQACWNSFLSKECECMDQSSTIVNKTLKHCSLFDPELRPCYEPALNEFPKCRCENPCVEIAFDRIISTSTWPTDRYQNFQLKHDPKGPMSRIMYGDVAAKVWNDNGWDGEGSYPKKYVENNIVRLHVYFKDFQLVEIEDSADYPFTQLIADLGGVISLYLGVSIATLLEVMQYIFLVAFKIKPK